MYTTTNKQTLQNNINPSFRFLTYILFFIDKYVSLK